MTAATLLNVATPGPALALTGGANAQAAAGALVTAVGVTTGDNVWTLSASGTAQNLDSFSLTPGTYVITGLIWSNTTFTLCFNVASGTMVNSWPVQLRTIAADNLYTITTVIKVTVNTTVYLNATVVGYCQGLTTVTKIA